MQMFETIESEGIQTDAGYASEARQPESETQSGASGAHQQMQSGASADASGVRFPVSMAGVVDLLRSDFGHQFNKNTLRSRWMSDKIAPAYEGLDVPALKDGDGLITQFGYEAIKDFISLCIKPSSGRDVDRLNLADYQESVRSRYPEKSQTPSDNAGSFLKDECYLDAGSIQLWERADSSVEVSRRKENAQQATTNLQVSINNYAEGFLSQFDSIGEQLGARALERITARATQVIQEGLEGSGSSLGMGQKKPPTASPGASAQSSQSSQSPQSPQS